VLWAASGTVAVALPKLTSGTLTNRETVAQAINDDRTSAGLAKLYSGFQLVDTRAVRWSSNGATITDLGSGSANGINNDGDIVGSSPIGATIWPSGGTVAVNLNDLIAADSGWVLNTATDISNTGIIVGSGSYDPDGAGPMTPRSAQFRLIPVPEPGGIVVAGLASCVLRRRSRCEKR
jgi:hypothetical protein